MGILNSKMWTRPKGKKSTKTERDPIEKKESFKWIEGIDASISDIKAEKLVHVCDREGDMYELFHHCLSFGTNFLVRSVHKRSLLNKDTNLFEEALREAPSGSYKIHVRKKKKGKDGWRLAKMNVRFTRVKLKAPVGKDYDSIEMYVISAKEESSRYVAEKDRVEWTLVTNMPIESFASALEKIEWYRKRWNIEVFFKTLKSGFGVENTLLKDVKRIKKFIALTSVVAWRVFWLSRVSRSAPKAKSKLCFTLKEQKVLVKLENRKGLKSVIQEGTAEEYVKAFAKLGGYMARRSDPPPGPKVLWRAIMYFQAIMQGTEI